MAARERKGKGTPNREGVLEEDVTGSNGIGQWEGREKIVVGRVVKEDETWREESRWERIVWAEPMRVREREGLGSAA